MSSVTPTTVTVERSNSYGTTTETFTITVADNASLVTFWFTEDPGNFGNPTVSFSTTTSLQYDMGQSR